MKAGKKKQLSSAAVFQIFSQLHELTGAGITPYAALGIMAGDADHGSLAELLKELADRYCAAWVCAGKCSVKGHPHHPLYLKKDEPFYEFDIRRYLA